MIYYFQIPYFFDIFSNILLYVNKIVLIRCRLSSKGFTSNNNYIYSMLCKKKISEMFQGWNTLKQV